MEKVVLGLEAFFVSAVIVYHWYTLRSRWIKASSKSVKELELELKSESESQDTQELIPDNRQWNTAIFFPDLLYTRENSKARQLIWYLQQARTVIKICMCNSNFLMFEQVLYDLIKDKGVRVIGISNVFKTAYRWKLNGIMARETPKIKRSVVDTKDVTLVNAMMHHKFIIIDDKAVMAGSLNWSRRAVVGNQENVIITTNEYIVPKYIQEFKRIWENSKPDPLHCTSLQKQQKPIKSFNIREPKKGRKRMILHNEEDLDILI